MNTGTESIGRDMSPSTGAWMTAFQIDGNEAEFSRLLRILSVKLGDVYTSRLQHTVSLCGALQGGRVKMMRRDASGVSFTELLGLLAIVNTHARLARAKAARIEDPGFYLRAEGGAVRPAMPLEHLALISGYREDELPLLLAPLIHDGAMRIVRDSNGNKAIHAADGYVDESEIRRFMKF
ncbi:hypothetical protein [Leisingera caerulea]|uniref:hypothetical protein n=1 Tax=Leisingera caerulea TaxID=506591 RepID=UPI000428CD09|nr:hypothetical protein [Leisingera caerulea]